MISQEFFLILSLFLFYFIYSFLSCFFLCFKMEKSIYVSLIIWNTSAIFNFYLSVTFVLHILFI